MVELMAPQPKDVIGDPACGTCGFLVAAGEFLRAAGETVWPIGPIEARSANEGQTVVT